MTELRLSGRAWVGAVVVRLVSLPQSSFQYGSGTQYLHSNIGYPTPGLALERAAGRPFTHYVQDGVIAALGTTHTAFELTPVMRKHVARGYPEGQTAGSTGAIAEREIRRTRIPPAERSADEYR